MSRYFLDDVYYFITVPTVDHQPFFNNPKLKQLLLEKMNQVFDKFFLGDRDYSIIDNHYHFIAYFQKGNIIPNVLKLINGSTGKAVRDTLGTSGRVWDEYHVYVASTEQIYERIRGYVIGNSLKHGEVVDLEELMKHPYSTFSEVVRENGKEYAEELVNSSIYMEENQFFNPQSTQTGS
ncbi:MAG: hypothetical protein ABIH67_00395 [Candidatus Uhrbacteria bacterium]